MSTSLKQAIEAAKVRVSAAFDAVVAKGGTKPSVANLAALPSAIESIPSGGGEEGIEKDINFFDHKHLVASYWISEIDSLTELPEPTHYDHLTFDGWTETLEEIKDGKCHEVGAMYHTTNGELRMGVRCDSINLKEIVSITKVNRVDWGDGQFDNILTHTYAQYGCYEIVVYATNSFVLNPSKYGQRLVEYYELPSNTNAQFSDGTSSGANDSSVLQYISIPKIVSGRIFLSFSKVEFLVVPPNATTVVCVSNNCTLRHIAISNGVTSVQLTNPTSLYSLLLPKSVTSISVSGDLRGMRNLALNDNITSVPLFRYVLAKKIEIPASVTSLNQYALSYLYGCYIYIYGSPTMNGTTFRYSEGLNIYIYSETPPTLQNATTFYNSGKPTVHVKASALAAYQADTNWAAQIANNYLTLVGDL